MTFEVRVSPQRTERFEREYEAWAKDMVDDGNLDALGQLTRAVFAQTLFNVAIDTFARARLEGQP